MSGGNDHLAIGPGDATGRVEAFYRGAHIAIHDDLAGFIQAGVEAASKLVHEAIAAGGKESVQGQLLLILQNQREDLAATS